MHSTADARSVVANAMATASQLLPPLVSQSHQQGGGGGGGGAAAASGSQLPSPLRQRHSSPRHQLVSEGEPIPPAGLAVLDELSAMRAEISGALKVLDGGWKVTGYRGRVRKSRLGWQYGISWDAVRCSGFRVILLPQPCRYGEVTQQF